MTDVDVVELETATRIFMVSYVDFMKFKKIILLIQIQINFLLCNKFFTSDLINRLNSMVILTAKDICFFMLPLLSNDNEC